jgi:hypothetical protein
MVLSEKAETSVKRGQGPSVMAFMKKKGPLKMADYALQKGGVR